MESQAVGEQIFSRREDVAFGTFHYLLGLVVFALSPAAQDAMSRIAKGELITEDDGDDDGLAEIAYQIFGLFHEMRHFIDSFGTLSGWSLVNGHIDLLQRFASLSEALNDAGMQWQLPLSCWAVAPDCPYPVGLFVQYARAFSVGTELLSCPFEPFAIEGHRDDHLIELDYIDGEKTDAFPVRIGLGDTKENLSTILFPIGFEALTEANAHSLSRNLASHHFAKSVAKRLEHREQTLDAPESEGGTEQLLKKIANSYKYMAVDLMISRCLRARGISTFPRDLVLAVSDRVLSTAAIQVKGDNGALKPRVDRAGRLLLELLQSEDAALLRAGELSDNHEIMRGYEMYRDALQISPNWEEIEDQGTLSSSLGIWETYIAKTFMLPLVNERIVSKGRAFTKHDEFLKLITKIGLPPARVANGKLLLDVMPERVRQAWYHLVMVSQIVDDLLKGKVIRCPRAFPTWQGVDTIDFAFEGSCNKYKRRGCGTFRPGTKATETPNCLFESTLSACALKRC